MHPDQGCSSLPTPWHLDQMLLLPPTTLGCIQTGAAPPHSSQPLKFWIGASLPHLMNPGRGQAALPFSPFHHVWIGTTLPCPAPPRPEHVSEFDICIDNSSTEDKVMKTLQLQECFLILGPNARQIVFHLWDFTSISTVDKFFHLTAKVFSYPL